MQSAKVSASTLRGYTRDMTNYIIKPLGEMYMEEVTADDIRLAIVPLSKKSEGLYSTVSKQLVELHSSASDNRLLRLYQKVYKPRKIKVFRGFLIPKWADIV